MVDQYLVISRGVGSIQRNLYWSALKRVVVPIPSKKEQMEIVEYLDGLNNKFDATIKKLTEEREFAFNIAVVFLCVSCLALYWII